MYECNIDTVIPPPRKEKKHPEGVHNSTKEGRKGQREGQTPPKVLPKNN